MWLCVCEEPDSKLRALDTEMYSCRRGGHVHWSTVQRRRPMHMRIFSGDVLRTHLTFSMAWHQARPRTCMKVI